MIKSLNDVIEKQLCSGCGACSYVEPQRYYMADALEFGRRPFLRLNAATETGEGLAVCPGVSLAHAKDLARDDNAIHELFDAWGPVYGVWEGFSVDEEIRFSGSSGGAASAIALYCLEKEGMAGVLHTAAREDVPYLNQTVMSTSREELLARTGSRYSPASPGEGLDLIEESESECVFIGKPCDVAGAQNARHIRPQLDKKLGLTIAFFCAGVPSLKGNFELLKNNGVANPEKIKQLRYRGKGWPGLWTVQYEDNDGLVQTKSMTYADSWGFLQSYRQWRCYICPDHTGEFADVAVGDPWYREVQDGEAGKSLIVARSKRGLQIIKAAESAGYLVLERNDPTLLPRSQPNLLSTRGALWARLKVLNFLGAAIPDYSGFAMFKFWFLELGLREKIQSVIGTAKRVFSKRLRHRITLSEWRPKNNS